MSRFIGRRSAIQGALCVAAVLCISAGLFASAPFPRPLADVPIPMPNGKPVNLKQYRGKVVLMAVISEGCAPCIHSIELLNIMQKEYGPQGFQVVGAVGDPNAQYMLGPFIERYRPVFPMGFLGQKEILLLGGFQGPTPHVTVPIFMFVDRKGVVQFQVSGESPFFKEEERQLRQTILALLKQR